MDKDVLISEFEKEFTAVGGVFVKTKGKEEALSYIQNLLKERNIENCVVWNEPFVNEIIRGLKDIKVTDTLTGVKEWRNAAINSGVGITTADYAISNTGTIVLKTGKGKSRLASLLPPLHICVIDKNKFVSDISEIFESIRNISTESKMEFLTTCLTFITGPSRTVDIELTLTIGVHGPKEIYVVIV